jgi:hypothetical protein
MKTTINTIASVLMITFTINISAQNSNNQKDYIMRTITAETATQGTPITSENVADVLEIQRITSALTNGCDSQQWDVIRSILVDNVYTTIGEEKGKSSLKSKEEIITRWKSFYDNAEKLIIHHVTSNERVFFHDSENATVFSKGVIVVDNTPAGAYAETGGTLRMHRWINYEFGVIRTQNGWKVNKVMVEYLVEEASSLEKK